LSLYSELAECHPKLRRGKVFCHKCGNVINVNPEWCLQSGWPKCCGETMSIDNPEERKQLALEA